MSNSLISGHGTITSIVQEETTLASVLRKQLPGAKFVVPTDTGGTTTLTSEQLADNLEAHVATVGAIATHRQQEHLLVERAEQQLTLNRAGAIAARSYAAAAFGESSETYRALGFEPRKSRQVKPAVQTEAIAKRAATRAARHTMGKRQRAGIHGVVPSVPVMPAAPAAPVTPTAPTAPADPAPATTATVTPMIAGPNKAA